MQSEKCKMQNEGRRRRSRSFCILHFAFFILHCPSLIALLLCGPLQALAYEPTSADSPAKPEQVLDGLKSFYAKTARRDGSFQPGIDPDYLGMSDSAYSDLAPVTYADRKSVV